MLPLCWLVDMVNRDSNTDDEHRKKNAPMHAAAQLIAIRHKDLNQRHE